MSCRSHFFYILDSDYLSVGTKMLSVMSRMTMLWGQENVKNMEHEESKQWRGKRRNCHIKTLNFPKSASKSPKSDSWMPLQHALTTYSFSVLKRTVLTDGHPLHWDLTLSAMIPTAASLASTDLTTPATSFPAASNSPASVPTNVRVCLRRKCTFNACPYQKSHGSTQSIYLIVFTWTQL